MEADIATQAVGLTSSRFLNFKSIFKSRYNCKAGNNNVNCSINILLGNYFLKNLECSKK